MPVRLPTGDEWEALARGTDARPWPWGEVFDEARCACAESVGALERRVGHARVVRAPRERLSVVGLPWLDEVLWQIVRYPNLYASIAATVNCIARRPRVFAETLGKMLWWCGEDKIIYGGENLARLHGIDVEAKKAELGAPG